MASECPESNHLFFTRDSFIKRKELCDSGRSSGKGKREIKVEGKDQGRARACAVVVVVVVIEHV